MKGLIVYYSYTGNTKYIANMLKESTGFDTLELVPTITYPSDYDLLVQIEEEKMGSKECVPLKQDKFDLTLYETIVLLSPVWWYHIHGSLRTFMQNNDLTNKKVYAMATNGGWVGESENDFSEYVKLESFLDGPFKGNVCKLKKEEILNFIK